MSLPHAAPFSPRRHWISVFLHVTLVMWLATILAPGWSSAETAGSPNDKESTASATGPGVQFLDHTFHYGVRATLQLDLIHDFNAMGLDVTDPVAREFITSQIPVSGSPASQFTNRTALSPNQSSLVLWASTETRLGEAKAFVDLNMTKSPWEAEFRVYKAWAQLGYLKFGLDYSLLMNQRAIPKTLDFEGPQSLPEPLYTHIKLEVPFARIGNSGKKNLFWGIGIEESEAQLTLAPQYMAAPDNQVPSIYANLTYNTDKANMTLIGVYRRLRAKGPAYDSSVNGWGFYLSGNINTWGGDSLMGGVFGGRGISALIDDTEGLNLDAATTSEPGGALKAMGLIGAWAAYERIWNAYFQSTAAFGFLKGYSNFIDRSLGPKSSDDKFVGIFKETIYTSVNLVWTPIPLFEFGAEYLYGHQEMKDGSTSFGSNKGHDHRIQVTLRINFEYAR
ncbi:MAG: hypothetical protein VX252_17635 [Myxococcota bacterium]|nr:hypothetical protein [Myxococcota bacterium]